MLSRYESHANSEYATNAAHAKTKGTCTTRLNLTTIIATTTTTPHSRESNYYYDGGDVEDDDDDDSDDLP